MAFTNYTIIPEDGVVVIDGVAAFGVSMTGVAADIHAIQWYGIRNAGVIEYKADPLTGELPAQGSFSDPLVYQTQLTEAEAIIYAQQNPQIFYSTINDLVYGGVSYGLGSSIVISEPNVPQPPSTTTLVPPTPESFQQLYWFNSAWVASSVDPSLSLADAKASLVTDTQAKAALYGTDQARVYSPVQLFAAPDVSALDTADYAGLTLGDYQTYLDGQVSALEATINAATAVTDLYEINPGFSPVPTP